MIEEGVLIPATLRPVGQGLSGAKRGQVKISGISHKCVVKPESIGGVVAECFAAAVGIHLGLPTLKPVIVRYPGKSEMWFGARDLQHPSLLTAMNVNDAAGVRRAALLLATWAQFGSTISFDELIANPDRNLQNLLWDGQDFWLIDHARALGNAVHEKNTLANVAMSLEPVAVDGAKAAAIAQALVQQSKCGSDDAIWTDLTDAFKALASIEKQYEKWEKAEEACRTFIHSRVPSLASNTANCFSPLLNHHANH
ncbi:hypothetical protein [Paraburkholderia sp. JHI869]|uniref:hypothetical protein n=1 Tax=Paraburkholderia sp. JHI869 TaxID=3112959 RepID=UPI00317EFF0A